MIKHRPILVFYFFIYIFLIGICLLNLVTAVIVEKSFDQADQDKELAKIHKSQKVKKMMPELREIFHRMDINNDGTITLDEFGKCDLATQATTDVYFTQGRSGVVTQILEGPSEAISKLIFATKGFLRSIFQDLQD